MKYQACFKGLKYIFNSLLDEYIIKWFNAQKGNDLSTFIYCWGFYDILGAKTKLMAKC